jgi:hypothetical protein
MILRALEDRKIGYLAVILGIVCTVSAWWNILQQRVNLAEVVFLVLGLVASLLGIALILRSIGPRGNALPRSDQQVENASKPMI